MRVKSFPEKLAKWECVDTQDPWLGGYGCKQYIKLFCILLANTIAIIENGK